MTYEIRPQDFGFTTPHQLLVAGGFLACFGLAIFLPPGTPTGRDIVTAFLTWLTLTIWWYYDHHYTLEIDDGGARVGGRVVRKGHVRYVREANPLLGGRRLVVSERGAAWVHLGGGAIVIPKRLPEYEQIKAKVLTWAVSSTPDAK